MADLSEPKKRGYQHPNVACAIHSNAIAETSRSSTQMT